MVSPMTLQYESNPKDPFDEKRKVKLSCPDIMQIKCTYIQTNVYIFVKKEREKKKKKDTSNFYQTAVSTATAASILKPAAFM